MAERREFRDEVEVDRPSFGEYVEIKFPANTLILGIGDAEWFAEAILEVIDEHTMENIGDGVEEICGVRTMKGFFTYPADDCPDHA